MTPVATARPPAIPHAPELSRADRLDLMRTMLRSRQVRREVMEERSRQGMPPLAPPATEGWEALEAAAARALRPGDALAAGADWPAPVSGIRRIGLGCRLTEMVSAGLGATIGAAPESVVLVLAGPAWGAAETAALSSATRRRAPLVVLFAAPALSATTARTAAGSAGAVFELVGAAEVEVCTLAVDSACVAARAGRGPTLIAFSDAPPRVESRWRRPPSGDPIARYAARLREVGIRVGDADTPTRGRRRSR
jgi:hypothetical protein